MEVIVPAAGWVFGILLALAGALFVLTGNPLLGIPLILIAILIFPPLRTVESRLLPSPLSGWKRTGGVVLLFALFYGVLLTGMMRQTSIYSTHEVESRLMTLYDRALQEWPVPFETRYVETEYGRVHLIVCGPPDASPLLLVHASGVASFSWRPNISAISRNRRVYAVDLLGEANRSRIEDLGRLPRTGKEAADLLAAVLDSLDVDRAEVVGASIGGFISMNLALHHPHRVSRVALLCPMGLAPTTRTVALMTIATMFPLRPVQAWAGRWALGEDPETQAFLGEWFKVMMNGVVPRPTMPRVLSEDELSKIGCPVLLILGARDRVVDADRASEHAQHIPGIRTEVLDGWHLIGSDLPDACNDLLAGFLEHQDRGSSDGLPANPGG